jgi:hypothetical protein
MFPSNGPPLHSHVSGSGVKSDHDECIFRQIAVIIWAKKVCACIFKHPFLRTKFSLFNLGTLDYRFLLYGIVSVLDVKSSGSGIGRVGPLRSGAILLWQYQSGKTSGFLGFSGLIQAEI